MPKKQPGSGDDHPVSIQLIERRIYLIRGQKVMLDRDLAELYQVKPIALRQQVKRNLERFPADFMFQLSEREADLLVSQSVIPSKKSLGGYLPSVFTQEGVAMLSSVLRSKRAIQVNVAIMRAFVRLRQMLESNEEAESQIRGRDQKAWRARSVLQSCFRRASEAFKATRFTAPTNRICQKRQRLVEPFVQKSNAL